MKDRSLGKERVSFYLAIVATALVARKRRHTYRISFVTAQQNLEFLDRTERVEMRSVINPNYKEPNSSALVLPDSLGQVFGADQRSAELA